MSKVIAYTPETTATILTQYADGSTLQEIATAVGKTVPMIRSKLVSEKVYKAQEKKAVGGASPVRKSQIVDMIEARLGGGISLETLGKGSKVELQGLLDAIDILIADAETEIQGNKARCKSLAFLGKFMIKWCYHESENYGEINVFFDSENKIKSVYSCDDLRFNEYTEQAVQSCGVDIEYHQDVDLEDKLFLFFGF